MFSASDQHLYVHIPYCAKKCPYCDFNSIAGRDDEQAAYVDALLKELDKHQHKSYRTIFIGGGTPTHLDAPLLEKLLIGMRERIALDDTYEWTCEANPGSTDQEQLQILKDHGVNRISIGIQSTHQHHLEFLGRIHNKAEAMHALELACSLFPAVSCDFIFGLPEQTEAELLTDLQVYETYQLQHASVYHLTIEPGTEFHGLYQRGVYEEIDQDSSWHLLSCVRDRLAALELHAYETSNFATADNACLHNLAYWQQRDYDAVGAGAVSTRKSLRQTRYRHPQQYIEAINNNEDAIWQAEQLSLQDRLNEAWMLGLRLIQGVKKQTLQQFGDDEQRWRPLIDDFKQQAYMSEDNTHIRLTDSGRPLQDYITSNLLVID